MAPPPLLPISQWPRTQFSLIDSYYNAIQCQSLQVLKGKNGRTVGKNHHLLTTATLNHGKSLKLTERFRMCHVSKIELSAFAMDTIGVPRACQILGHLRTLTWGIERFHTTAQQEVPPFVSTLPLILSPQGPTVSLLCSVEIKHRYRVTYKSKWYVWYVMSVVRNDIKLL